MEGPKVKRPIGVSAVSGMLLTTGAVIFAAVLFVMCSDMEYLTSAAGWKMQAIWLFFANVGFAVAAFGLALWQGSKWSWSASLAALFVLAAGCAYGIVFAGPAKLAIQDVLVFAMFVVSALYLLAPSARAYFHGAKPVEQKSEIGFATAKIAHGAA